MGDRTYKVSVGNVVGGGSASNGMQFDRRTDADYDAWEELGNAAWGYRGLADYFKKSTHFDGPSEAITNDFNMTYDAEAYGDGPLNVSIPNFQYDDYQDIWASFIDADVLHSDEGFARLIGTFWTPNTVDSATKEHGYARTAYYEPVKAP
jgi:choline dehydrogenase-like flavoprotein